MKVGVLTFHKAKNYGAVLQTFALLHTLKTLGVKPVIIDRYAGYKTFLHFLYFTFHPKFILGNLSWFKFNRFSQKHLQSKTRSYASVKSLDHFEKSEDFDAVIVGSDQVWRMEYSAIGYNYFFDFVKNSTTKKISYAASFGKNEWSENENVTNHVKSLLKEFHAVSVREKTAISICHEKFDIRAVQVLDPTLLIARNVYEKMFLSSFPTTKRNRLVSYILGNKASTITYCGNFATKNSLAFEDLYHTYPIAQAFFKGKGNYFHKSVPDFLNSIRTAKYVITNSFHATVFSILFHKQFLVIDHPDGGSDRISSLLDIFSLQNRFIKDETDVTLEKLEENIDYNEVELILSKQRIDSINFLQHALNR